MKHVKRFFERLSLLWQLNRAYGALDIARARDDVVGVLRCLKDVQRIEKQIKEL